MPNKKNTGFSTFHITQGEAYEQYSFPKNAETSKLLKDFFLETYSALDSDCFDMNLLDEYPDNYVYLRPIPNNIKRAKTKAKLLPLELVDLLKAYRCIQPDRSNPSDESIRNHRLSEFGDFAKSIQGSDNKYLKTILNADPVYQNIAILPAFLDVFSKQIVQLIDLLMGYSLEMTPYVINRIVKGMYALIDQIDVNYAGNQYRTQKLHPENPFEERKKINIQKYVYTIYYDQLRVRKNWFEDRKDTSIPTLQSLPEDTKKYSDLRKAVSSLSDEHIELSADEIKSSRQQYLNFLYENHISQITKDAAQEFQDIYESILISEDTRRQHEKRIAMQTMEDAFHWLIPSHDNTVSAAESLFSKKEWNNFMDTLDIMWEFPRLNELFRIIGSDIANRFFPVMNAFSNLVDVFSKSSTTQTAKTTAFYTFKRVLKNNIYKDSEYYQYLAQEYKQLNRNLVFNAPTDGQTILNCFISIFSLFLKMLFSHSIKTEYDTRSKENLGPQSISKIASISKGNQANHKTNTKNLDFSDNFCTTIKHSIIEKIFPYTY